MKGLVIIMLICVTNRKLCRDNYLQRLEKLLIMKPEAILLREKDLPSLEYEVLATKLKELCSQYEVKLILHQYITVAARLKVPYLHLSLPQLRDYHRHIFDYKKEFDFLPSYLGASIHSLEEAMEAKKLGASYLIAGHIYSTDCKKDLPPRGITFLQDVCKTVDLPVYGIGGITMERIPQVIHAGAAGFCIMSELMTCDNPSRFIQEIKRVSTSIA